MELTLHDFTYVLPPEKIAAYPLPDRDQSKLLVYEKGEITHRQFYSLADRLPVNTILFFNNTKVIPARLLFQKETGSEIEIFLLTPVDPSAILTDVMQATDTCTWKCTIGNLKRWTPGLVLQKNFGAFSLQATLLNREEGLVKLEWPGAHTLATIVSAAGETPLPPYIKRKPESLDRERYQTIYSAHEGAVAAPTAGLHFTDRVLKTIHEKGIRTDYLTLHVSAGTFQPIKVRDASTHVMHREQIVVNRKNLENLLHTGARIIPVGTTSMRTLESLYWFGVKLLKNESAQFEITQHDPYLHHARIPTKEEALTAILKHLYKTKQETLVGETSIYIMPGYEFKICSGLITNFHQPASTLILLVAAFIGKDWKRLYNLALENDYRFLSYGDSSLLLP